MTKVLAACAALLAAAALAGCGSSEEAAPPDTTEPETTHTTTTETPPTETAPTAPAPVTVRIAVRSGRPVGGIARPKVRQGDRVVLVVSADTAGDVHLHGYDLERRVAPGAPARIGFRATIPGRFEIELHAHPEVHIGELTVTP
ncbi:MAG: hypothetical protein KatS3mg012_1140 [Gaiellaceae bacterium]|nr:MAG: hypothetical protein KatS3mg012_1140 [Gaiellaceae bacterium]